MTRAARVCGPEALAWPALIRSGERVTWCQGNAEPQTLLEGLLRSRSAIGSLRAFVGIGTESGVHSEFLDRVAYVAYCGTGPNAKLGSALDILPLPYSHLADWLAAEHTVLLLSLAPGRDDNSFSCGASADYLLDLLPRARLVIAEVNARLPRTSGPSIPRDAIDVIVEVDRSPPLFDRPAPGATEKRIGELIAGLIDDGATLQIGLGSLPAAVLQALRHHRDLGVHSGLVDDGIAELAQLGVVTNARKSIDRGIGVAGFLCGGEQVLKWADRNDRLALRPTSYTHNPAVLARIDQFVAVNSAIEVDLTGQVNAEVAGDRYLGAVGGGGAFLRGALASRGGLPIIALPSLARGRSRIVHRLSGPVSTARSDIGLVVTEHGVADLRGCTIAQRYDRMLAIAAPDIRDALANELD